MSGSQRNSLKPSDKPRNGKTANYQPTSVDYSKRITRKDNRSEAQILMGIFCRELGFDRIEYEYQFFPERKWKADLFLPDARLLLECDGGLYRGGHKRGAALEDDYERQNRAQMMGFRILRFSNQQVLDGRAKEFLKEFINDQR